MSLTTQSLNLFNNQGMQGVNFLPQFGSFKEGGSYSKRCPNCQKCGQHGRKSRLKGHKRICPFKDCSCAKCQVVTERQKLMADQIKVRRHQRKQTIMNLTRDNLKVLNAVTAAAVSNPQPYISNLTNLNMLCKQIVAQSDANPDSENQQPVQFNSQNSPASSMQIPQTQKISTSSSAFSPTSKADSPQLVTSPFSTIGTDLSLSPQQYPRLNSFDLLNNRVQQQQLLSAALFQQDLKNQIAPAFELTPSTGLIAPIPVNPVIQNANLSYDNLLTLSQLLTPPAVSTPSLLQFVQPASNDLQGLLTLALLQQLQGQQTSPPPVEKSPHQNGFIDVCSV